MTIQSSSPPAYISSLGAPPGAPVVRRVILSLCKYIFVAYGTCLGHFLGAPTWQTTHEILEWHLAAARPRQVPEAARAVLGKAQAYLPVAHR